MLDFYLIFVMDWLHKCYTPIDCRNKVVRIQFPNDLEMEWKGICSKTIVQIISHLKVNKMIAKGYLYHLVRLNDLEQEVPSTDYVSIVNEF